MLARLAQFCESLNHVVGRSLAWLPLAMVLLMCGNVIVRYFFNAGAPWQVELVLFLHAALFLGAMGYTYAEGEQVRVDVLYARFSKRTQAWINLLGTLLLLFPVCLSLIWFSWDFVASAWELREASSEFGGMQGIWLLKTFLLIGPALLALQGVAVASRAWLTLRGGNG